MFTRCFFFFLLQKLAAEHGGGSPIEAIAYARKHFSKFVDKFEKEIQLLMGTLMYIPIGLENSPYRGLCGPNLMIEVIIVLPLMFITMCLNQFLHEFIVNNLRLFLGG